MNHNISPVNEPVLNYAPNSPERARLQKKLAEMSKERIEIPCIIGGKEIRTGNTRPVRMPHSHEEIIADLHWAGESELLAAVQSCLKAKQEWEKLSPGDRSKIFLKAADLLAGPWREKINAATMLGQSKNAYQAEIDSACELIDFWRMNAHFYEQILDEPLISPPGLKNSLEFRPLEGFILAITPFNFTAIAGNLPSAPAMLGNTVVWKPSDTQALSAYYTYKLLEEAGLPPGVINFVPADGPLTGKILATHPELGGIHFTGSTPTFIQLNQIVAQNLGRYRGFPRIVGETGGKDFVFADPSANIAALRTGLIRGAYEYQGQKCSAASRAYIPESIWSTLKKDLVSEINDLKVGDVRDFKNFVNAVIDERAFTKISGFLDRAKNSKDLEILCGGSSDKKTGYFVQPTLIHSQNPKYETMTTEIFGPVLSVYIYKDREIKNAIELCEQTSPYALTGAIFSEDPKATAQLKWELRNAAGNLYLNDKPTGAVVGQQPFGGARMSGTNDKAGSYLNLIRFLSPRTVKENLAPPTHYTYPFLES